MSASIPGHPVRPRDLIEAGSFSRDIAWADYYGIADSDRELWLGSRARARRDLLWHCRNILRFTRLTEAHHRAPANFVMSIITAPRYGFGDNRDPRGNGKTSLATIGGPTWTVIQDPIECIQRGWAIRGRESRLGVNTLKAEFTANIMQALIDYLESADFRAIFPDCIPDRFTRWGQKGVDLARGLPVPLQNHPLFSAYPPRSAYIDPTIAPRSLESGSAGAHTHGEFIDDPVNEKTWDSELNISTAIHGIDQLFSVVRPERGFRLVTGNDWAPNDVNDRMDAKGAWRVFMRSATACDGCKNGYPTDERGLVLKDRAGRPAHKHVGTTFTWLMEESDGSTPDLTQIRAQCGSMHIYLAQYENDPVAPGATLWASDRLPVYEILEFRKEERLNLETLIKIPNPRDLDKPPDERYVVCRVKHLSRTLAFDPSAGGKGRDASEAAITVLGRTPVDNFCWLSAIASQDDPLSMLGQLVDEVIRWRIQRIAVESVAYQRVIKGLLVREFASRNVNWLDWERDIVPVPTSKADGDKETKIRESLNPLINGKALIVSPFMDGYGPAMLQLEGFPVRKPWDTLDSLTMHSHVWGRIPLSLSRRKEIRLRELQKRRERHRNAGTTGYGW